MSIDTTDEKLQKGLDEVGEEPSVHSIPFIWVEGMKLKLKNVVAKRRIIGGSDSFIFGHDVNGVLGVANGLGGGQIILGDTVGDATIELMRRAYIWNTQQDFDKGTKTNIDTSHGFIQLGNVTVRNLDLQHKSR